MEERDGLLDHRVAQLGRVLGEEPLVGLGQVGQAADAEPLAGEVLGHRPRLRVGEHPPHLEREHLGLVEPPGVGQVRQLRVGHRRPEEIREPAGQLVVGDAIRALDVGPVALDEIEEARARPGRPAGRAGRRPRSRRRGPRRGRNSRISRSTSSDSTGRRNARRANAAMQRRAASSVREVRAGSGRDVPRRVGLHRTRRRPPPGTSP